MSFRSTRSVGFSTPSRGIVYRNSNVPAELPPDRFNRDSAYIRSWSTCSRQCRGSVLDERTFAFPFSSNYRKVSDRISFSQTQCRGDESTVCLFPCITYTVLRTQLFITRIDTTIPQPSNNQLLPFPKVYSKQPF